MISGDDLRADEMGEHDLGELELKFAAKLGPKAAGIVTAARKRLGAKGGLGAGGG
jgi:hypothetical protein